MKDDDGVCTCVEMVGLEWKACRLPDTVPIFDVAVLLKNQ